MSSIPPSSDAKFADQCSGTTNDVPKEGNKNYTIVYLYDEGEDPIERKCVKIRRRYKKVPPLPLLPPFDPSTIGRTGKKGYVLNFYKEHKDIGVISTATAEGMRFQVNLTVFGEDPPKLVPNFSRFNMSRQLYNYITKGLRYKYPTPCQAQGLPSALKGRDVLLISKAGCGKTYVGLWSLITHVSAQRPVEVGEGPIALVIAATTDQLLRIFKTLIMLTQEFDLRIICADRTINRVEKRMEFNDGAEVVIGLSHNMVDHIRKGVMSLERVTFVAIYEHERMIEGYCAMQLRSIIKNIGKQRQTLLFASTLPPGLGYLARNILQNPIIIINGIPGQDEYDMCQKGLECYNETVDTDEDEEE